MASETASINLGGEEGLFRSGPKGEHYAMVSFSFTVLHFGRAVASLTGSDVNGASWRWAVLSLGSYMLLPEWFDLFKQECLLLGIWRYWILFAELVPFEEEKSGDKKKKNSFTCTSPFPGL